MGVNASDVPSKAGRQTHDSILMVFHQIGHGILANTGTERTQNLNVTKPEVPAGNQEDDVET